MRRALVVAGISLTWEGPAGAVEFLAIKNPIEPASDGVDRNTGNNTPCTLDTLVEDYFPGGVMPTQDDSVTGDDGLHYRISRREWVPGQAVVQFHCPNVVTLPAPV